MRPKELFGVVVRTIGLLWTISVLFAMFASLVNDGPFGNSPITLLISLPFLLAGLVFLSGAEPLVDWAYRNEPEPKLHQMSKSEHSDEE